MAVDSLSVSLKQAWGDQSIPALASKNVKDYLQFSSTYKGMLIGFGGGTEREKEARAAVPQGMSTIPLTAGMPDKNLLPFDDLMEFAKKAWENSNPAPLQYGTSELLRKEIAQYLTKTRGREVMPNEIYLSSGNTGGLKSVFRGYLGPGDIALVESPLWTFTVDLMTQVGADVVPVGMDREGILVDEVEQQILAAEREGKRIKMIYLQPLFHNPTGATLTLERAERLLHLTAKHRIIIVCDEPYEAFCYGAKPCYLSALSGGYGVLTVHTFSKSLGTGLRLGYIHSSPEFILPLTMGFPVPTMDDSVFWEFAVGELMASGRFEQIIARAKSSYISKAKAICDALKTHVGHHLVVPPSVSGGFFVWLELARLPAAEVNLQMLSRGVEARVGGNMYGPKHPELASSGSPSGCHIGLSFVGPSEEDLVEAAKRIGAACDAVEAQRASKL